jgi:hypothetical protein
MFFMCEAILHKILEIASAKNTSHSQFEEYFSENYLAVIARRSTELVVRVPEGPLPAVLLVDNSTRPAGIHIFLRMPGHPNRNGKQPQLRCTSTIRE